MHIKRFKEKIKTAGFALPSVLIASIIMITVLLVAVTSTAAVRSALVGQYYNQLSQTAADAGAAYANSCLDANNGIPLWSDANPLMPNTDCSGTQLAGFICPSNSVDARCSVMINGNVKSSFSIGLPVLDGNGRAVTVNARGITSLLRESTNIAWRSYTQANYDAVSYPGVVTAGLTMNLDAGDPLSYPGSGITWNDLSGNGNRGILTNGPTYSAANDGYLSFDGVNEYASVPANNWYGAGGFTVSAWVNWDDFSGSWERIIDFANGPSSDNILLAKRGVGNGDVSFDIYIGAFGYSAVAKDILVPGEWAYITGTVDGNGVMQVYKNGVIVSENRAGHNVANVVLYNNFIGKSNWQDSYLDGKISNIQIYNRGLSASEIQQDMNATSGRFYDTQVQALVVGGGGGGGSGGGGGGGFVSSEAALNTGAYDVIVGAGGAGCLANVGSGGTCTNGQGSKFGYLDAAGGGSGGRNDTTSSANSGSSGGGGGSTSTVQTNGGIGISTLGNAGGTVTSVYFVTPFPAAGGGGAGAPGNNPTGVSASGNGGAGRPSSLTGALVYYGGGGGGSTWNGGTNGVGGLGGGGAGGVNGVAGTANTGGGGGGGAGGSAGTGGTGGSGVVVISYPTGSIVGTGGTITTSGGRTIHRFTTSGVFTVGPAVQALLIGGGGGAGSNGGGGGGGGGYQYKTSLTLNAGAYPITVGAGGVGAVNSFSAGLNGGNSVFNSITALGGGGGASRDAGGAAKAGSSGGGGGGALASPMDNAGVGTVGQGSNGGAGTAPDLGVAAAGGGGGGCGTAGTAGVSVKGGNGGGGIVYYVTGAAVPYCGGGAGGVVVNGSGGSSSAGGGTAGVAGAANTGGGAGGSNGSGGQAANGGSGVVIISYPTGAISATGGTITTVGGYTIHRFTTSGTFTVN